MTKRNFTRERADQFLVGVAKAHLQRRGVEVLAEGEPEHVKVLPSVPERAQQLHEHCSERTSYQSSVSHFYKLLLGEYVHKLQLVKCKSFRT